MNFGGTLVIRNMLKIALAILASLVKFQDCLHCLEARTDFVFFACNKHKTIVIGFYIFFQKNPVDTKFRSWLCFVKQFALWLRRDVFRHQHGEFFFSMQSTFCHSSSFLAGPCPACSSTRPCVVSITTVFLGSTSLHLIPIKSAIVVC